MVLSNTIIFMIIFIVLNIIKKHKEFLCILQNLCLFENNEVCFLTLNVIIKLCQFEKEETKVDDKFLVWIACTSLLCIS